MPFAWQGAFSRRNSVTLTPASAVLPSDAAATLNASATTVGPTATTEHGAQGRIQQTERRPPRESKRNVHTVPHESGWANRREGADRVSRVFPTKDAAERAGRDTARRDGVEHLIHNKDGRISERNSYGNDPFPPPG